MQLEGPRGLTGRVRGALLTATAPSSNCTAAAREQRRGSSVQGDVCAAGRCRHAYCHVLRPLLRCADWPCDPWRVALVQAQKDSEAPRVESGGWGLRGGADWHHANSFAYAGRVARVSSCVSAIASPAGIAGRGHSVAAAIHLTTSEISEKMLLWHADAILVST